MVKGQVAERALQQQSDREPAPRLIPLKCSFEARQGPVCLVLVVLFCPDFESHPAPIGTRVRPLRGNQLACNEAEEVAGLWPRVDPNGIVPAAREGPLRREVAVAEQDREAFKVGDEFGSPLFPEGIGAIRKVCDAAEALGLTLGKDAPVCLFWQGEGKTLSVRGRL